MDFYKKYLKYKKKYLLLKKKSSGNYGWSARNNSYKKGLLFHIDKVYKKKNNNKQFVFEGNIVLSHLNNSYNKYKKNATNVYVQLKPFKRIDDKKIQIKKFFDNDNENYEDVNLKFTLIDIRSKKNKILKKADKASGKIKLLLKFNDKKNEDLLNNIQKLSYVITNNVTKSHVNFTNKFKCNITLDSKDPKRYLFREKSLIRFMINGKKVNGKILNKSNLPINHDTKVRQLYSNKKYKIDQKSNILFSSDWGQNNWKVVNIPIEEKTREKNKFNEYEYKLNKAKEIMKRYNHNTQARNILIELDRKVFLNDKIIRGFVNNTDLLKIKILNFQTPPTR